MVRSVYFILFFLKGGRESHPKLWPPIGSVYFFKDRCRFFVRTTGKVGGPNFTFGIFILLSTGMS